MTTFRDWIRSFGSFCVQLTHSAWGSIRAWSPRRWILIIALALAGAALFIWLDIPDLSQMRAAAARLGAWFPVAFTLGYVIFTQFPLPRTIWTVAAGILFGPWQGLAISLLALTISAVLSLLIVRRLLGEWIRPHLAHPAVYTINAHLERRGWLAIASLRMVAGVPFSLLNYVAALTPISVSHFTVATLVGSIPTTVIGVFFGDALTGTASPGIIVAFIVFALAGIGGLILDSRLPTPAQSRLNGRL